MINYKDIRHVHLELTEKCQAMCLQCPRTTSDGSLNKNLSLADLNLENIKKIFTIKFILQLDEINLCGNYGDASLSKDCLLVLKYFREVNPRLKILFMTNGGARNVEFWKQLAETLGENGRTIFAIDGLEETSHIYRQGVVWTNVIRNLKAYVEAGGKGEWHYLVFEHNEHQVEEASALSASLGLSFVKKVTSRMPQNATSKMFFTRKGEAIKLGIPNKAVNKSYTQTQKTIENYGSLSNYLDVAKVTCKTSTRRSVFITAEGLLFPCCWIGALTNQNGLQEPKKQFLGLLEKCGGKDKVNCIQKSIESIVEGSLFKEITDSWTKKSIKEGKLLTCSRQCGDEIRPFESQFVS